MKNILLFGHADSSFVRDFCTEVLNAHEIKTAILSQYYSGRYADIYRDNNITVVQWSEFLNRQVIKNLGIRMVSKYIENIKNLNRELGFNSQIDVAFVHYVEPFHLICFYPFWKKTRQRILVFWGSDILRASNRKLKLFPFFLKQSTDIVFMTQSQCEYFHNKFGYKYDKKIHILDFGNKILDKIDKISIEYTTQQCKEEFGFPADKIIVHVGYNALKEQQHLDMMRSIVACAQLPTTKEWIEKIKFVFHVSYGRGEDFDDYRNNLKVLMNQAGLDYVFMEEFFQNKKLVMFRKTCDIFLYGNKTDARSASPLEYIYLGACFICPVWLKDNYGLLDEGNIPYFVYDDFNDLTNVFNKCLSEYMNKSTSNCVEENISPEGKKVIRDTISWESLAPKWRSLYGQ